MSSVENVPGCGGEPQRIIAKYEPDKSLADLLALDGRVETIHLWGFRFMFSPRARMSVRLAPPFKAKLSLVGYAPADNVGIGEVPEGEFTIRVVPTEG
jgi:hypothetical protein